MDGHQKKKRFTNFKNIITNSWKPKTTIDNASSSSLYSKTRTNKAYTTKKKMLRSLQQHTGNRRSSPLLPSFFLLLMSLFYTFQFHHAKALDHHIFIYAGCSREKYPQNSPYENNLNSLLSSIVTSASQALYNSFAAGNDTSQGDSGGGSAVYGLYQCRGDLKTRDCSTCVANLVSQIQLVCPYNYEATLQLDRCFVRYEHIDFLGRLDTNLRFKKCGKGNGNGDVEFLKRRDDVLGDLQQAGSGFRVSSSGSVEGYAQCVGDLSAADCSTCLGYAVTQLKNLCGSAAAADVFLAQCYARYWASGYYDSSDSSGEDDVGRTVAIIVGVLAGAAIVVVVLSICRKAIAG